MKLLIVEASPDSPNSLYSGLRRLGYRVDAALDAREAGEMAVTDRYDIIIIDFVLPRASSLTVLEEIRESCPRARILILSPFDDPQDRVTSLIQGADEILIKPFDLAGLHAVLQDFSRHLSRQSPI